MKKLLTRPSVEDLPTGIVKLPLAKNPDREKDRLIRQLQRQIRQMKKNTQVIGYWVVCITKRYEMVKFGRASGTVLAFKFKAEAERQADDLSNDPSVLNMYIVTVRATGQVLTEEYK